MFVLFRDKIDRILDTFSRVWLTGYISIQMSIRVQLINLWAVIHFFT